MRPDTKHIDGSVGQQADQRGQGSSVVRDSEVSEGLVPAGRTTVIQIRQSPSVTRLNEVANNQTINNHHAHIAASYQATESVPVESRDHPTLINSIPRLNNQEDGINNQGSSSDLKGFGESAKGHHS